MNKKEFSGNLQWISPEKIIGEFEDNKVGSFFIGLGVIFNDLKDLRLFEQLIMSNYRKPKLGELSSHVGNYGGTMVHINKLIASTINEFFAFLRMNANVFDSTEFKEILNRLPPNNKEMWGGMVAASRGKAPKAASFLKTLVRIRNNIAFHYDHSGKVLKKGYASRFFGEVKDKRNEHAYYSIGDSLEFTRFYFSDAAVEECLYLEAGKKEKKKVKGDESLEKYKSQIRGTIELMNYTIMLLLKNFLQYRRNLP